MDDQTPPPGGTATAPPEPPDDAGPRVTREQVRDFRRLRRSRSDRYVAGVAGGLGRHLDVDPTVVRVVLAVLTLFGGAGLLVYLAVWLLVPEDGTDASAVDVGSDVAKVLVLGAGVVAALMVLGISWDGSGWLWFPWPLLLVALAVTWLVARGRRDRGTPPPAPWTDQVPPPSAAFVPPAPPRPRRTGIVLFWPALALVAVSLGALGLADVSYDVPFSAYAALALAVTGAVLLLGAFRGRPGGLIALGLAALLGLVGTSVADVAQEFGPYGQTTETPVSAEALTPSYDPVSGDFTLDLRDVEDPDALDGRSVRVAMDVGQLTVLLPEGVNADVDAEIRWAGDVALNGGSTGGGTSFEVVRPLGDPTVAPSMDLDLELGAGQIEVYQAETDAYVP